MPAIKSFQAMPVPRNAGGTEVPWLKCAGNQLIPAGVRQNRRLQLALAISCLLHALVYVHYRSASMEDIDLDAADSRHTALNITLPVTDGGSSSEAPHLPDLADASHSSNVAAIAVSAQVPEAGDKWAGATTDGDGKLPPDEPYYTRDMLNRPAQPISDIRLTPEMLPLTPPRLLLELWIDKHGSVRSVLPLKPDQVSPAVLRSFEVLRFIPASRDGLPVISRKLIELALDGS
jgi:hypothetical protein